MLLTTIMIVEVSTFEYFFRGGFINEWNRTRCYKHNEIASC